MICGDHVCINKKEANLYFEENLSLEVKIINKKEGENVDLVELNLEREFNKKKISISRKDQNKKKLKKLTKNEIKLIKTKIKTQSKDKKVLEEKLIKNKSINMSNIDKRQKKKNLQINNFKILKKNQKIEDVCTIIEKCNIEEISKYLIKVGKNRKYPDITDRERLIK